MIPCHMGIDLGGGDIGMTQHFLHRAQIRAMSQQVGCESVTQNVRADAFRINTGIA